MNFHVLILADGQWKEELFVFVELVDGKLPLDFDHQIKMLVFALFGISSFVVQATENSYDGWRF